MIEAFEQFSISHVPRDQNREADALAYLGSKLNSDMPKVLRIDVQQEPAYAYKPQVAVISEVGETETEDEEDSWMTEIKAYLLHIMLPTYIKRAHKVQLQAKRYAIRNKDLYRKSASGVLQKCLLPRQGKEVLNRIHQEEEGNHSGAQNLALKAMR